MGAFIDMTDKIINNLKFIKRSHRNKWGSLYWEVQCHCGKIFTSRSDHIRGGRTKSCGCGLIAFYNRNPNYKLRAKTRDTIAWASRIIQGLKRHAKKFGFKHINLTGEELLELRKNHNQCCDICHVPEIECKKSLCVDHDHQTGEFRGFLCRRCNIALGYFEDSLEGIEKVVNYLSSKV